jgi:hypothetical protein
MSPIVVNSLQSIQIFDTVLLPCYLPLVYDVRIVGMWFGFQASADAAGP